MTNRLKCLLGIIASTITLLAVSVLPAQAGSNSTLPPVMMSMSSMSSMAGPCGSSYSHIGHYWIGSSKDPIGFLDVYWSWTTKRNCLVTNHHGDSYGVEVYTEAKIRPSGFSWPRCPSSTGCDGGFYSYYAGPVYTPAGVDMTNRCIDISGWVDWASRSLNRIHCG